MTTSYQSRTSCEANGGGEFAGRCALVIHPAGGRRKGTAYRDNHPWPNPDLESPPHPSPSRRLDLE
jgi:hypothetical protein